MNAIRLLARAELRRRRLGLVVLGLLAGIVGAAVLGGLAAARRTSTAYNRLAKATALDDARLIVFRQGLADRLARAPSVDEAWVGSGGVAQILGRELRFLFITAGPPRSPNLLRHVIVEGRAPRPDATDEVLLTEFLSRAEGIDAGDEVRVKFLTAEEVGQFDTGFGEPDGPALTLRVVGIGRVAGEEGSIAALEGTPALHRFLVGADSDAGNVVLVRLRGGPDAFPTFRDEVESIAQDFPREEAADFQPYDLIDPTAGVAAVEGASGVLTGGLLVFAGVALIAGLFVLLQVIARSHAASRDEQRIQNALGMTRSERAMARGVAAFPAGALASVVAVAGAIASSAGTPGGTVKHYEPSPGIEANLVILLPGAIAVLLLVIVLEAATSYRFGGARPERAEASPSLVAERAAALGGPAWTVIGLRFAFERGPRTSPIPVRSALAGAVAGVAGVVTVFAFAASLDRLVTTPERFGWQGDFIISDLTAETRSMLEKDPRVGALSVTSAATAQLASGEQVSAVAFRSVRGRIGWEMLDGRPPEAQDEVAVGPRFARRKSLRIGQVLRFAVPEKNETRALRITGIGLGPPLNILAFGDEVTVAPEMLTQIAFSNPFLEGYVRAAPGVNGAALANELSDELEITKTERPVAVENLRQLGALPNILGGFLAFIGAAAIANSLIVGVRRRRRDLAVLRVLGFVRRQLGASVRIAGAAVGVVGLVIGVPLGLFLGSAVWGAVARSAYVGDDALIPGLLLGLIGPAVLLLAVGIATLPAGRAARVQPAQTLRSE